MASDNCASKTGFAKIVCLANAERDTTIAQARTARTSAKNACALKSAIEQSTCSDLATASYDYKTAVAKAKAVRAVAKAKCKRSKSVRARSACNVAAANRFLAAVSRATSAKVAANALAVPGTPATPTAVPGNARATVTVAKGTGASPTSYTVTAVGNATKTCTVTGASGSCAVTGLTNGTTYTFKATASNSYGTSGLSAASSPVTPTVAAPAAPATPTAVAGDAQATVTVAAGSAGGTPESYAVTAVEDTTKTCTVTGASGSCDVPGLTNDTAYTFTATATNAAGTSAASGASNAATPLAAPAAPASVSAAAGDAQATATVVAPGLLTNVDHYKIEVSDDATKFCVTPDNATLSCDVTGLTNGTSYAFTATSVNINGTASTPTAASTPTVTPLALPDVPAAPSAAPGAAQAVITVTPNAGGTAVSTYTVTAYDGPTPAGSCTAVASNSSTCTGLTNGTPYTFTVTAANANGGTSTSFASSPATPLALPDVPAAPSAAAGVLSAVVTVTPNGAGTPVSTYTVAVYDAAGTTPIGAPSSCTPVASNLSTCTSLLNGTSYTFKVTAANANGGTRTSLASGAVTPLAVPAPPASVSAVAGDAQATATVVAPGSLTNVDHYRVQVTADATKFCVTPDNATLSCNINGLTNGTAYTFTATSVNANGTASAATAASNSVTPSVRANAPLAPIATAGAAGEALIQVVPNPISAGTTDHYRVEVTGDPTSFCVTPNNSTYTCTITGLAAGSYTFRSVAVNFFGADSALSPESNSVTVS